MTEQTPTGVVLAEEPKGAGLSMRPLWLFLGLAAGISVLLLVGYYRKLQPPNPEANPKPLIQAASTTTAEDDSGGDVPPDIAADHASGATKATAAEGTDPTKTPGDSQAPPLPPSSFDTMRSKLLPSGDAAQQLSPAEQARLDAYRAEQQAITTSLKPDTVTPSADTPAAATETPTPQAFDPAAAQAALSTLSQQQSRSVAVDRSREIPKSEIANDEPVIVNRKPPAGQYMLRAGTWVHFHLTHKVVSELPGDVQADIDERVLGEDGSLLIPQGSHLLGTYNSRMAYGQDRLLQVWSRLIFPDNSSMQLADLSSYGSEGVSGIQGHTNHYVGDLIRNAAIMTVFSAGIAVTQRQNTNVLATPSISSTIGQQVGSNLGSLLTETTRRSLDRSPTAELSPGAEGYCLLNRDLLFRDGPYKPMRKK